MGLDSVSMYRRVPRDISTSTNTGGLLSLVALATMTLLFVSHVRQFTTVSIETDVEIDHHDDENIRLELNVTMHQLPCSFLSVAVLDTAGNVLDNITSGLHFFRKNAPGMKPHERAHFERRYSNPLQIDKSKLLHSPQIITEAAKSEIGLIPLTAENFDELRSKSTFMFVRFYSDWDQHSEESTIEWQLLMAAHKKNPIRKGVVIHHISCTESVENAKLCLKQRVRAFPTMRVYFTPGGDYKGERGNAMIDYDGPRDFPTMGAFVTIFGEEGKAEEWKKLVTSIPEWQEECEVAGVVMASRVPGKIKLSADSPRFSFNPAATNISHTVNSMRFAPPLPGDKHTFELERIAMLTRPQVELADESTFLLGAADTSAIFEAVDESGRKRRPKPRGALAEYLEEHPHKPGFGLTRKQAAHLLHEQLEAQNFTGNLSDPEVRKSVHDTFMLNLKLQKVQSLVTQLRSLPPEDRFTRSQIELELELLDGKRLLAMMAYKQNSTRFKEMHPELFKEEEGGGGGAPARRLLFGEGGDDGDKNEMAEAGGHARKGFPMGKWLDTMPDVSKEYYAELRRRKAVLEETTPEELRERDTAAVRARRSALNALFKQEPKLLSHYDHLAKADFTTQFRRSTIEHHIKVVPITYTPLSGAATDFYEYTVANREAQRSAEPAAYFTYEVSPVRLNAKQTKEDFITFITQLCAVVGGVFVVVGLIDSTIFAGSKVVQQKLGIGKLS